MKIATSRAARPCAGKNLSTSRNDNARGQALARVAIERLVKEIEAANQRADQAEDKTQFYHQELRAASRLGYRFAEFLK